MTISKPLALLCLASTLMTSVFSCEWEETLTHIIERPKNHSLYTTLAELNGLIEQCPDVARLVLEKGTLLYKLQHYQSAIEQWQSVINHYALPENVALKVKLKILDAQKKKQQQRQHLLITRTALQGQSNESPLYGSISVQGKSTFRRPPVNLFNQPAFTEVFLGYGGLIRQPLNNPGNALSSDTLLMFLIGGAIKWQHWQLPVSLGWNIVDNESQYSLSTMPRVKWRRTHLTTHFTYDFNDDTIEIEPEVRIKWTDYSLAARAEFQQQWQTIKIEAGVGQQTRLELSGEYDLALSEHELGIEISTYLSPDIKLSLSSDVVLTEPNYYWKSSAGLVWKVY